MEQTLLTQETITRIKDDGVLFGKVAVELGISPVSLPRLLYANDAKLTQAGVLRILCIHLKIENQNDLLETIKESENKSNAEISQMQTSH